MVSSREDFHLQDCAHDGRTHPPRPEGRSFFVGRFTLLRLVDVSLGRRVPFGAPRPCDKLCLGRLQRYHETRRGRLGRVAKGGCLRGTTNALRVGELSGMRCRECRRYPAEECPHLLDHERGFRRPFELHGRVVPQSL